MAQRTEDRRPTFAEALSQRPANVNYWEHSLSPGESLRIRCQTCGEPAVFVQRAGFPSFHYHCAACAAVFRQRHQGIEYVKP